ncbi:MAG: tandem-95 repeat protein [Anaerolineae bacterium]
MAISLIATLLLLTGLFVAFAAHGPAGSHLVEVGPIHPNYGFPMWYKDSNGLILEQCLDPNLCGFLPGDIPDVTSPISMPGNFPEEGFFWLGEAIMPGATPGGGQAIITLALEGAFANGPAIDGDQVVFGRIRIRVDNLIEGETYTVTHPYGMDVFPAIGPDAGPGAAAGPGISFVEDIGIGAPGDFTGALYSRIGPFLTIDPASAVLPPPGFIGDGGTTEYEVVGSPFNTNFFRVEGVGVGEIGSPFLCADPALGPDPLSTTDCIETSLFTLLGKEATNLGVTVEQATYSRKPDGTGSIDAFGHTISGEVITLEGPGAGLTTMLGDVDGNYYARIDFLGVPPASVIATNISDNPPTIATVPLVDMVTITRAEYDAATDVLVVEAHSSDLANPPTLTAVGLGTLTNGSLVISPVPFPPMEIVVESSAGGSDTELLSFTYNNATPVAVNDEAFLIVGATPISVTIDILANDYDPDGFLDPTSVVTTTSPANGSITIDPTTGVVTYTPNVGFLGIDSFNYTVNDNVNVASNQATVSIAVSSAPNNPPVANGDTAATDEEVPVTMAGADWLLNDTDPDGDTLSLASVDTASANGGVIVDNLDGTYTYTPVTNFFGSDTFTYRVGDGRTGTATGTVTVTVAPINDLPVATADGVATNQNTAVVIPAATLLANDTDVDGDTLTVTAVDTYSAQALEAIAEGKNPPPIIDNGDGTYTYTPIDAIYVGPDTFSYQISDGNGGTASAIVNISVVDVNDPPVAVADAVATNEDTPLIIAGIDLVQNDTDLDGNTLTVSAVSPTSANGGTIVDNLDGTYTYSPAANYNGSDTFTYTVVDGQGGSDVGTVTAVVAPINDPPIMGADTLATDQDVALTFSANDLLANDMDVDGDILTISFISTNSANGGPIVDNNDDTYTYTPPVGFTGNDGFIYTASDGAASSVGTVSITVSATPPPEVVTISRAEYNDAKREWRFIGTGSIPGHSITLYVGATVGGQVIASGIPVRADGSWFIRVRTFQVAPDATQMVSAQSTGGGTVEGVIVTLK